MITFIVANFVMVLFGFGSILNASFDVRVFFAVVSFFEILLFFYSVYEGRNVVNTEFRIFKWSYSVLLAVTAFVLIFNRTDRVKPYEEEKTSESSKSERRVNYVSFSLPERGLWDISPAELIIIESNAIERANEEHQMKTILDDIEKKNNLKINKMIDGGIR